MTSTVVGGSRGLNATVLALSVVLLVLALVDAPTVSDRLVVLVPVAFLVVGWTVLRHDPAHVEGRLVLLTGLACLHATVVVSLQPASTSLWTAA